MAAQAKTFRVKETLDQLHFVANGSLVIIVFCVCFAAMVTILESSFHMKLVIQNDSMVKVFNKKGEIIIRAKYSHNVQKQTLFLYPNHPIINKLITFTASDMGQFVTGGNGNALNNLQVNIENVLK